MKVNRTLVIQGYLITHLSSISKITGMKPFLDNIENIKTCKCWEDNLRFFYIVLDMISG